MIPWIDSGSASTSPVSVQPPSPWTSRPRSCSIRTTPARTAGCPRAIQECLLHLGWKQRLVEQLADQPRGVLTRQRRERDRLAFVFPPAQAPALQQLGSGRADDQQRHRPGPVRQQVDEVNSASSAQWISSNTSAVGPSSASASKNLRHAANASTRPPSPPTAPRASRPTSGRRCRLPPSRDPAPQAGMRDGFGELRLGRLGAYRTPNTPAWLFTISPSAQKATPSP